MSDYIRRLQEKISDISMFYSSIPSVEADGIYGDKTEEAVIMFQRNFGLPATGQVDMDTWDKIMEVHSKAEEKRSMSYEVSFRREDAAAAVDIMVAALCEKYENITGIRSLQKCFLMDETGIWDDEFFRRITRLYGSIMY